LLTSRYILNVNDIFCTILTFIPCHYFTSNKELLSQNPLVVYHVIKHQIEKEGPYMIYYYSNPLRDVIFSFVNLKVFFLLSFFSWCKTTHVFLEMLIVVFVSGRHKFNISVKISEPTSYTSCKVGKRSWLFYMGHFKVRSIFGGYVWPLEKNRIKPKKTIIPNYWCPNSWYNRQFGLRNAGLEDGLEQWFSTFYGIFQSFNWV